MQPPIRVMEPGEGPVNGVAPSMAEPVPMLAVVNAILRNRFRIAGLVALFCGAAIMYSFLSPRQWISTASFSIQESDPKKISGLAAQFGINLPTQDTQSPEYYIALLTSRDVLAAVASSRYTFNEKGKVVSGTLADIWEVEAKDANLRAHDTQRLLKRAISASKEIETGIVKVGVAAKSPVLAQQILTRLLDQLNDFNRKTRQSRASNERRFVERRLAEQSADLRAAEDRYKNFLQQNRGPISNIPELAFQRDRFEREVSARNQVYMSLVQNYEQARIDEVRDAPAITLIEPAGVPARPAGRGTIKRTFIALTVALLLGIVPLLMRVMLVARRRSMDEEIEEFRKIRGEMKLWRRRSPSTRQALNAREA